MTAYGGQFSLAAYVDVSNVSSLTLQYSGYLFILPSSPKLISPKFINLNFKTFSVWVRLQSVLGVLSRSFLNRWMTQNFRQEEWRSCKIYMWYIQELSIFNWICGVFYNMFCVGWLYVVILRLLWTEFDDLIKLTNQL